MNKIDHTASAPDLTRIDLNLLVVFEALMAERHVGRAAARLHLSQSATSHALGRLREMLADPLFLRHPKGVAPTPRALALAAEVAEALARVRRIVAPPAPFDPATLKRGFAVGATDYAVFVAIAPVLGRLQAAAPGVDLRISPVHQGDFVERFDRGELDLVLGNFPEVPRRLERFDLFEERFVGVVRRGHPRLDAGRLDLETFASLPQALVAFREPRGLVDEALAAQGLSRRVALTVSHFLALPFIIGASDLVGVLAERAASRLAQIAGLSVFELPLETPRWTLHLLRNRQRAEDPALAWLSDFIVEQLRADV